MRRADEIYYREQQGPEDAEVKQPADGVEYRADSPLTWQKKPTQTKGIPPGNPGFTNLPERDSMNPSSAKVIPTQMNETIRDQLTYLNASASRVAARTRTAALMDDILSKTGPEVHKRSKGLQVQGKRFSPDTGFWSFTVIGSSGKPYYVRIKGIRKTKAVQNLSAAQVKCSCSCQFWRWQGPEHWGKQNGFLYGRPRGTASVPVIRDPKEKHWACKHLLAALDTARTYRFASEQGWSLDGDLVLAADPVAVTARYAASLWFHGSPKRYESLQTSVRHTFGGSASEVPLFFSPSRSFASMYAVGPEGTIYTARLKWRKVFDGGDLVKPSARYWPPEYEELTPEGQTLFNDVAEGRVFPGVVEDDLHDGLLVSLIKNEYDVIETTEFKRWLKKNGYDAAYVTGDGERNVFVFSPKQVEIVSVDPR